MSCSVEGGEACTQLQCHVVWRGERLVLSYNACSVEGGEACTQLQCHVVAIFCVHNTEG